MQPRDQEGVSRNRNSSAVKKRENRVVNLLEHQLIICSMENASWVSVVGSPNEVFVSEPSSPNFKELQKISTSNISLHRSYGCRQVNLGILVNSLILVGTSLVCGGLTQARYCNHS